VGKTAAIGPPDHADAWPAFPTNPGRFQIRLAVIRPATRDPAYRMRFSGGNRSMRRLEIESLRSADETCSGGVVHGHSAKRDWP
jgi:hypothetical protein